MCIKQKSFTVNQQSIPVGKVGKAETTYPGGLESVNVRKVRVQPPEWVLGQGFSPGKSLGEHDSIPGPEEHDISSKQSPSHENRTPVKKTWAYVRIRLTASRTILKVELFQYFLSPVRFSSRNYGQDQHCR